MSKGENIYLCSVTGMRQLARAGQLGIGFKARFLQLLLRLPCCCSPRPYLPGIALGVLLTVSLQWATKWLARYSRFSRYAFGRLGLASAGGGASSSSVGPSIGAFASGFTRPQGLGSSGEATGTGRARGDVKGEASASTVLREAAAFTSAASAASVSLEEEEQVARGGTAWERDSSSTSSSNGVRGSMDGASSSGVHDHGANGQAGAATQNSHGSGMAYSMSFGAEVVQSLRQLLSRMQKVLVNPDGIAADPQAVGFDGSTMAAAVGTASSSWSLGAGTDVVNRVLKGPGREPDGEPQHQEDKEWQKQQHRAQQAQADDVGESVEWVNMCWRKVGWGVGRCGGHICWERCGQGVCITRRRSGRERGVGPHVLVQGGLGCGWVWWSHMLEGKYMQGAASAKRVAGCAVSFHVSLPRWGKSAGEGLSYVGHSCYVAESAFWNACWLPPSVPWGPWGFGLGLVASLSRAAHTSSADVRFPISRRAPAFNQSVSTPAQMWRVYQRGLERWIIDLLQPVFDGLIKDGTVPRFLQVSSWVTGDLAISEGALLAQERHKYQNEV